MDDFSFGLQLSSVLSVSSVVKKIFLSSMLLFVG